MWDVQKIAKAKSGMFSDQAPGGLAQRVESLEVGSLAKRGVVAGGTASRVIINGSAVTFLLTTIHFFSPFLVQVAVQNQSETENFLSTRSSQK